MNTNQGVALIEDDQDGPLSLRKGGISTEGFLYPESRPGASSMRVEQISPDVNCSPFEPLSHGPMLDAASSSAAEAAGLIRQDRGLVSLVHQVFESLHKLPKVVSHRAKQGSSMEGIFPLPLPRVRWGYGCKTLAAWEEGVIRSINWMVINSFDLGEGPPTPKQNMLLEGIQKELVLLEGWGKLDIAQFDPREMFKQKWVNSYGVEVHVSQPVRWENISESLPKEGVAGIVPAHEVCEGGFKDFILHPQKWLKSRSDRVWVKSPKCMVPEENWNEVAHGLVNRGICGVMPLSEALVVDGQPILGGMFGVPKNEPTAAGIPILRLIMDFRPINENFLSLGGDLATLPMLSHLVQLQIQPHESICISSEDIRAMFYIIGLPDCWKSMLGFSRPVPDSLKPLGREHETFVLYSKVLPMGYVNSVSVSQHLHRRLVIKAFGGSISSAQEIRRDREFPRAPFYFRTYLDNFDVLSVKSKSILESPELSLIEMLHATYHEHSVPRNEKKAVSAASAAEMQGAWLDGERGICSPKGDKVARYLASLNFVLHQRQVSRKQMQMLAGGLIYMFSFRRPLMSILNEVWSFIVSFSDDKQFKPLPSKVIEELIAAFMLAPLSFINFRLPMNPTVTASDASEGGGGLCATTGLTDWGLSVSQGSIRGDKFEEFQEQGLLVISLFDGIGSLRVALDGLQAPLAGYVAIEKNEAATRVMESHFPSTLFYTDVTQITQDDLRSWAAKFPNCIGVLIAGGPPCQGVSSLNAAKKGAHADPRSSLHKVFDQIKNWAKEIFTWCPTYHLMESVASVSSTDRIIYSRSSGVLPYQVDAQYLAPCRRPRLWWFNWIIPGRNGVEVFNPTSTSAEDFGEIRFWFHSELSRFLRAGWKPVSQDVKFLTFTTAQPMSQPRYRPAGIERATEEDKKKWAADRFRFPPYAYQYSNGVIHSRKGWRMLDIQERETMMFFPKDFTQHCASKTFRDTQPQLTEDLRLTLIGNSWHVGVVACLIQPLLEKLGLSRPKSVEEVLSPFLPGGGSDVSSLLLRPGFERPQPFQSIPQSQDDQLRLLTKLGHLVSSKGSDILLKNPTEPLPRFHRLRTSLNPKLWKWQIICGWKWRPQTQENREHINKLEMRAVETSLRWHLFKQKASGSRIFHLVDSIVSLHVLNKGRTSSWKLRSVCKRIAALQLAGRILLILAYTNTKGNPADAPSRARLGVKRKWAKLSPMGSSSKKGSCVVKIWGRSVR